MLLPELRCLYKLFSCNVTPPCCSKRSRSTWNCFFLTAKRIGSHLLCIYFSLKAWNIFKCGRFCRCKKKSVGVGGMFKFVQLRYLHVAFPNDYLSLARELLALKMWKHWLCSAVGTKHFQIWLASSCKITAAIHCILL